MAKRQTRRTISLKGVLYERFRELCEHDGFPMAAVLEGLVEHWLARHDPRTREAAESRDARIAGLIARGCAVRPQGVEGLVVQSAPSNGEEDPCHR